MLVNERNRASDSMQLLSGLQTIEKRIEAIEPNILLLVSAIAVNPVLRSNAIIDKNTSQYTRTVMTTVPAVVLNLILTSQMPNQPFPTTSSYLEKLFKALGDNHDVKVRNELGVVFSQVIDKRMTLTLSAVGHLLSDLASVQCSTMRSHIMKLFKLKIDPFM